MSAGFQWNNPPACLLWLPGRFCFGFVSDGLHDFAASVAVDFCLVVSVGGHAEFGEVVESDRHFPMVFSVGCFIHRQAPEVEFFGLFVLFQFPVDQRQVV